MPIVNFFFFFFRDENRQKLEDIYYVLIDEVEELDGKVRIQLNGISAIDYYDKNKSPDSRFETDFFFYIIHFFQIDIERTYYNSILNEAGGDTGLSKIWIRLKISKIPNNQPILHFIDDDAASDVEEKYLVWIDSFENEEALVKQVNKYFERRFEVADVDALTHKLRDEISVLRNIHLNVYNVGQGNLTAVCDSTEKPILYFDLGGGFAWNKHTYPIADTLELCWCTAKNIFISHWDMDHVETLRRYRHLNPSIFKDKTFIASREPITPAYKQMAQFISTNAKLFIWPENELLSLDSLAIGQCIGEPHDKNNSGLFTIVNSLDPDFKKVLNPADSAYKFLPQNVHFFFNGLLATHHGANFKDNNSPVPSTENGYLVISCGSQNTYHHPKVEALESYRRFNWGGMNKELDTRNDSHISFSHKEDIKPHVCINPRCNILNLTYFK